MSFIARSIAAKIALSFSFVVVTLVACYIVMDKRLETIATAMINVTDISSYTTSIVRINKEIFEIQRDISVYSMTGSDAVFGKINETFKDVKARISALEGANSSIEEETYIKKLSVLTERIGGNLEVLAPLYKSRSEMIDVVLEDIYQSAITHLNALSDHSVNPEVKLEVLEVSNSWHTLHRSAWLFLTKKDYSKKQQVYSLLQQISLYNRNLSGEDFENLNALLTSYKTSFAKAVQVNRNYLNLVNVVMAGDANEFGELSNILRELSLDRLKSIKEVGDESILTTKSILNLLSLAIVLYLLVLAWFFHVHITKAIARLTGSFSRFLNSDLSAPIHHTKRTDEIGVLAQAASRFRDMSIDLEKEKKAAEHTSKVKSEFLANMSHEIRTPMNGVLGMAAQLQETDLSEKQKEMLDVITSSGLSLLVVINDILDLSKIEANKIDLEKQPIDLEKMFRTLEFFFKKQALDKGVKLSFEVPNQRVVFLGDETRLKQVLINILGNAIKFTDNGEVVVNVKAVIQANKKVNLLFSITDTGIGIEAEYLDRLFDAFSQADTSITRKFGGTGLGLTITSKLLKLMGSELKVDSQVGCGSKFYFEMEAEVSDQEETISDEPYKTPTTETFDYSQLKVLVAEDNKTNQIVIKGLLSKLNVGSIVVAEDGERAIEQCLEHEFDLIFMDMQMPVKDGLQATLEIKSLNKNNQTPVIALTANVFEEDRKRCAEVGMCDFLGKPINLSQLEGILIKWAR